MNKKQILLITTVIIIVFVVVFICLKVNTSGTNNKNTEEIIYETEVVHMSSDCSISENGKEYEIKGNGSDYGHIKFFAKALKPNKFYEISLLVDSESKDTVYLCGPDYDINMMNVYADSEINKKMKISRIVCSDDNGELSFNLFAGKSDDGFNGKAIISEIAIKDVNKNKYYVEYSEDKSVGIIFNKEDIDELNEKKSGIIKWLNLLSKFKTDLEELTNKKIEKITYVATENFNHYGLAGNPIYISKEYVKNDINRICSEEDKNKQVLWGYVHEMCHLYDGILEEQISAWVFDTELSAQLKTVYVLNKNNLSFGDGKKAMNHFEEAIPLERGIYSDEGFLNVILKIMSKYDKDMNSLKAIENSEEFDVNMTTKEKFNKFMSILSNEMKIDIKKELSEKEWEVLSDVFFVD